MIDHEQPHQELVKCVVVGDTAVGKTRLICARACNQRVELPQLLNTHVPTVWAIDQYRMCKDVLERSWEVVDGVNVSLRLWDTFGDHEKDRRFAYGRSDVVLLCFSLSSRVSLSNCKAMWFPEIRKFCPQTPVLLVGCKNDLRFMYRDESYLSYFRERSPFIRPVRKSDLVMPEEARALADKFDVPYYETSVFTYFGVNAVFENAIRAALIARRHQRFWMTNLKKVQRPMLQPPCRPPMPKSSPVQIQVSTYDENILSLYQQKIRTDVILVVGSSGFAAHKFILAASSSLFYRLFTIRKAGSDPDTDNGFTDSSTESSSEEVMQSYSDEEIEYLIKTDKSHKLSEPSEPVSSSQARKYESVFLTVKFECNASSVNCETSDCSHHTIVTLNNKLISPDAMAQCMHFLYTGSVDIDIPSLKFQSLYRAANLMKLNDLMRQLEKFGTSQYYCVELKQRFKQKFRKRLIGTCLEKEALTDIIFHLKDGQFAAHRALLSSRCDVMRAMFSGNFIEKNAKVIKFPGVTSDIFRQLLTFLYSDEIEPISSTRCLDLIELANLLCLTRLMNLVEKAVIDELNVLAKVENPDMIKRCLELLEPCQLHNATQLAEWCMIYLCVNYNTLCVTLPKSLKELHPDNQDYLKEYRWPPVWYIRDENHMRHVNKIRQEEDKVLCKRDSNSKRLCFRIKNDNEKFHQEEYEVPVTVTWKIR